MNIWIVLRRTKKWHDGHRKYYSSNILDLSLVQPVHRTRKDAYEYIDRFKNGRDKFIPKRAEVRPR